MLRTFFAARDVLEVDTPVLGTAGSTDPHLASFSAHYSGPGAPQGRTLYLQTSPEFAMKRLLAAGSGPIYQIGKAFRDGEAGRLHNPEFSLLEWYRPGFSYHELMDEVDVLLRTVLGVPPAERCTYHELLGVHAGVKSAAPRLQELRTACQRLGIVPPPVMEDDVDDWLTLLWTHAVEPRLGRSRPSFVYDYPATQAMLARVRSDDPPVAERFEVFVNGVELANGFQELADAAEQRRRFEADLTRRRARDAESVAMDERLLAALATGLPPCSGVALGVDRLVMLATATVSVEQVIAFPIGRA